MNMSKQARFKSLQSNGPVFPKKWEHKGYHAAGEKLPLLAEEMAWKAARFIGSDYEKECFASDSNMWKCFYPELTKSQQKLSHADYIAMMSGMKATQEILKEEKKALSKEEKIAIKNEKEALKEKYGFAILDGESVPLSGYMIEESNWILTRGKDPRKFCWKYAVEKSDVTLNIVNGKPVSGFNCISDNTVIWVMRYKIKCGRPEMKAFMELNKIIAFAPSVSVRQANNSGKFDKSKNILKNWNKIQSQVLADATDCSLKKNPKHEALIVYLIQETGIRIGGEKDERRAKTYGMSTLEKRHITLGSDFTVTFDFLGKDSVPETRTIIIDENVWYNLESLLACRDTNERIFNNDIDVNGYLKKIHPGATVKNLRTVKCNEVLVKNLKTKKVTKTNTEAEKLRAIFEANLEIAKTMNHQKNIGKNQKEGEVKIAEKVQKAKARVKELKKKHKEKIIKLDTQVAKIKIAFKGMKILKEKLAKIEETKIKMIAQMERAVMSIEKTEFALDKKKLTADIALGTSLANYADPNVIYSYCKYVDLPIERIYSASQRKNLTFAESVDANYWINYPS